MKAEDILELSDKYQLPEWAVREEIEKTMSEILTRRLGYEVEALLRDKNNSLELLGFIPRGGDIEVRKIPPESLKRTLMRRMKYRIAQALQKRSVLKDYEQLKDTIRTVAYGSIVRTRQDGTLIVDIQRPCGGESVLAVCELASQTPKEKGIYWRGDILPFFIKNIQPLLVNGIPRLEISLSRNSKGLVEGLLREELRNKGSETELRCVKRIAGAYSQVRASRRIPRECIKNVSDELKERIIVTY